jgi:hypothetical protein
MSSQTVNVSDVLLTTVRIGNGSGTCPRVPGSDWKDSSVLFQTPPKSQPTATSHVKLVPVLVNPQELTGLLRTVVWNLWVSFSDVSIYGRIQISYCEVQNINFGTSLSLFVLLPTLIIKTNRDKLPPTA